MTSSARWVWLFAAIFAVLAQLARADHRGHRGNRHSPPKHIYQCLDAKEHNPINGALPAWQDDDSSEESEEDGQDFWTIDTTGRVTLYCWDGCCNRHDWTVCCQRHDDNDDDKHGYHKRLVVVAIVGGALAICVCAFLLCVCVLKKKARSRSRVSTPSYPVVIVPQRNGMKKPLPEDGANGFLPPAYKEPFVIQGVAPPEYSFVPGDNTPRITPDAPPSYSTLSLHRVVRESEGAVPAVDRP